MIAVHGMRFISWPILGILIVVLNGCSATSRLTLNGNDTPVDPGYTVSSVVLKDGRVVEFDDHQGTYIERVRDGVLTRAIVGLERGRPVEIDPKDALEVRFEKREASGAGNFGLGFLLGMPTGALVFYVILLEAFSR